MRPSSLVRPSSWAQSLLGRSLLLGCGLLLGGSLLLGCSLLLWRGGLLLRSRFRFVGLGESLLILRRKLVGVLDLYEISVGYGLLERAEEGCILPLLVGGELILHVLLDSNHGGSSAVLEVLNGRDDSDFV